MTHSTTLTYTPALVRQSVWAYWKRSVNITLPLVLVLLTAYAVAVVREGNTGWTVGVLGTIVVVGYLYLVAVYVLHLRHGLAALREMGSPQATFAFDDAGFTVASGAGQATLPWRSVQEVWRFPRFWLLMFSSSQYITLPLDQLPEGMQADILARVQQHGGKVP
jgi:YcxB-like protein